MYASHYLLHRNLPNFRFPCAYHNCPRNFKAYAGFKSHLFRDHKKSTPRNVDGLFVSADSWQCRLSLCRFICADSESLMQHIRDHIDDGVSVPCPVVNCHFKFSNKKSFSSHMCRKHGKRGNETSVELANVNERNNPSAVEDCDPCTDVAVACPEQTEECDANSGAIVSCNFESQFMSNIALLYMKLQGQYLLPSSTIQVLVDEFASVHALNHEAMKKQLADKLAVYNLSHECITNIINDVSANDLFARFHDARTGVLRSEHTRFEYFKECFRFIAPVQVNLGKNASNHYRCYHYVSIKESLAALISHCTVQDHMAKPVHSREDVLTDFKDGKNFISNPLFQESPGAIQIILFQDAFELVNPLGSAKKKHKILAVYFTICNLPAVYRSSIAQMQLVLLCKEIDFKQFAANTVFRKLMQELSDIETSGVSTPSGKRLKGTVVAITGDNLGSHCIGGFAENFTGLHVCRYCDCSRDQWVSEANVQGTFRTEESYNMSIQYLNHNPQLGIHIGIKGNSVFNSLQYFHVCKPGLPPCLAHDLFEGVIDYDLALIIHYIVRTKKWLTYDTLNNRINRFPYLGPDARSKPCEVQQSGKRLGGHAAQNWVLVRFFGLIMAGLVQDVEDPVWQLYLVMCDVISLVCAPCIEMGQISLMKTLLEEYLELRLKLFSGTPLRPKHHYLVHYPLLTLHFGPLVHFWTMRFESKHSYFKKTIRNLHNFKNVTKTLATRHQLFQCYQMAGNLFSSQVDVVGASSFCRATYCSEVQDAVDNLGIADSDLLLCSQLSVHGTVYKNDMFVILQFQGYRCKSVFGKILLILVHDGCTPFLIVKPFNGFWRCDTSAYVISSLETSAVQCHHLSSLPDYCPLMAYRHGDDTFVALKHTCVPCYIDEVQTSF